MDYQEITGITETEYVNDTNIPAAYYQVAVGNVRGNPLFTDSTTGGQRPDSGGDSSYIDEGDIEPSPCVTGFSAEMISPNTVVFQWDKPDSVEDGEDTLLTGIRISTDESSWTSIDIADNVTEPEMFTTLDNTIKCRAVMKYYLFDPNVVYKIQIKTRANTEWCESDSIWWIDSYKWLSNRWCDSTIGRYESPLFLAHIYRYRNTSELSRLVHIRTGDFLSDTEEELLVGALSEYYYQQDNFSTVIDNYFSGTNKTRTLKDGTTETITTAEKIREVISVDDLIIYPDPLKDIASVKWSIETAAGGFNKNPTAIKGFANISTEPTKCMLEKPFYDRYCEGNDPIGYNFYIEPGSVTINGTSTMPFTSSGAYIFKVLITPTAGNPIVLTYNVNVSS